MKNRTIGIITGGGDCPGLNSVIRAVVKTAIGRGINVIGFRDGYIGLVYNKFMKLASEDVSGLLDKGGTILGTTNSFDPFHVPVDRDGDREYRDMSERIKANLAMHEVEALIVIGGNNTINSAARLAASGIKVIAVPKTIENDIPGTEITFGFMTAVDMVTNAIDRLHSTAESHHRVMVVEVAGSQSGWVALESGIAGGADLILIPEIPYDIHAVARKVFERKNAGKGFSIIVVAEGCVPVSSEGHAKRLIQDVSDSIRFGGVGTDIAMELEMLTQVETRVTVLGYLQRGGNPSPFDRILTTRLGVMAVNLFEKEKYNCMIGVKSHDINAVDLSAVVEQRRNVAVDGEMVNIAKSLGVSFGV